jgi:hypothetical protein
VADSWSRCDELAVHKMAGKFLLVAERLVASKEGLCSIQIVKVGSCEHGNEPSGSLKCWEVLDWLHNWQLLKKGSAP